MIRADVHVLIYFAIQRYFFYIAFILCGVCLIALA